ncbi:MAG: phosphoenolpyruvate--protein phosphotransferase [Elusimicrobia bacterium RIFCSPLOWO2_12_FULL_59_9]|nr:MAG: phosphoenolpyruvate--protein phosphotransferase [Elusimicrobia bacterium RIFCSPLOWO2_12_FULL_59_9]
MIKGIAASPNIAIGPAFVVEDEEIVINQLEIPKNKIRMEIQRFKRALEKTNRDLDRTEHRALKTLGKAHAKLIETHRLILSDPLITKEVLRRIQSERVNAEFALSEALEAVNQAFEKIEDEFFRERRHDVFDVGKRLLSHLMRRGKKPLSAVEVPSIVVAHNLLPSDTLQLKDARALGFATDLGGKSSHTAILAQSLELPAVVGLSDVSQRLKTGDTLIVDGEQGLIILYPTPEVIEKYVQMQAQLQLQDKALENLKGLEAVTRDGKSIQLMTNLDAPEELKSIAALNTDGIGLFRTEYLFSNRTTPPSEKEQHEAYFRVFKTMAPKPVVFRTADIGGDRITDLGFEEHSSESNPFMGLRGIRLFLHYPELFKVQLRAILKTAPQGDVRILLPMISSIEELISSKKILKSTMDELAQEGVPPVKKVELGIMVEIPSVAMALDTFLDDVDFISIGTNDLIQYLLAVDRLNENVAYLYDPFHPAVVRTLHQIVETAHSKEKPVGICGEMPSDPKTTKLLVGLGVDSLSVTPRMFLRIKRNLRSLSFQEATKAVKQALLLTDSASIRKLLIT